MGLFSRSKGASTDFSGLGAALIAVPCAAGSVAPAGATLVLASADGQTRRQASGKLVLAAGERGWCFHPGPYSFDLLPFAAAPEWGLRLRALVDGVHPRMAQQRFDLFLLSEVSQPLPHSALQLALQAALQHALASGALELPPCTTVAEWHAFRAGLNQLVYTRFGLTVDDCVPLDLAPQADYAALLRARASAPLPAPQGAASMPAALAASPATAASMAAAGPEDGMALRRLLLELPALTSALRVLPLPAAGGYFEQHQTLLLRLGMASLNVASMPALGWAAPDQPLPVLQQQRRSAHSLLALQALDEGWALLARMQLAGDSEWPRLLDESARIWANLETGLAGRRQPYPTLEQAA